MPVGHLVAGIMALSRFSTNQNAGGNYQLAFSGAGSRSTELLRLFVVSSAESIFCMNCHLIRPSLYFGYGQAGKIHNAVKNALIKEGWKITHDPYIIVYIVLAFHHPEERPYTEFAAA